MLEAEVKRTEPMTVAYIVMSGSYDQIPQAMGRLYGWLGGKGLRPEGMPHGVYLTDPAEGPIEQARWEVWAPVTDEAAEMPADAAGLGVKRVPAMLVAAAMHKGPYESIGATYEGLMRWVTEHGYHVSGPPEEVYFSDPSLVPPEEYLTEVLVPVAT